MTEDEAGAIFAVIAVRTNGWDDPSSDAWIDDLQRLNNPTAGIAAARKLVDTHEGYGRPAWGTYRAAYLHELTRIQLEQPAIGPAKHERVTLAEHLERLVARADTNQDAAAELATWRRIGHGGVPSLVPHDWQRTLTALTRPEQP